MSDPPTTKPELMTLINERWDALQSLFASMTDEELDQPLGDGWSAKVHLAHVSGWERSLMGLLRKGDRGAAMGLAPEVWSSHDTDAINAALADLALQESPAVILQTAGAVHGELMALLESLSQEDLEKPYSEYQPGDLPYNGNPVGGWVHGNTWDHYNEHIGWLEAGLRR
ncbi:MAG: ClbS/DfsB family four-helix bundle protein [Dehalococcoidia bacterium]